MKSVPASWISEKRIKERNVCKEGSRRLEYSQSECSERIEDIQYKSRAKKDTELLDGHLCGVTGIKS